jgi:uncharacterized protein RhaS with RHS repeats
MEEEGGLNLYAFVQNDPNTAFDFLGLDTYKVVGPFLVVHPSWWKFWRDKEECYFGTEELYEKIIAQGKAEDAVSALAAATILGTILENDPGNFEKVTDGEIRRKKFDVHQMKEDYVGREGKRYNVHKDQNGNVVLFPVKPGQGEPVPVYDKWDELPETYPIQNGKRRPN